MAGWIGTRCDQPSSTEWAAQKFHYNITFKHKIPIRKWTADDLSNSGYKIDVGASYRQDHQDAFNTINDPSFRVRVMIEVDSMTSVAFKRMRPIGSRHFAPLKCFGADGRGEGASVRGDQRRELRGSGWNLRVCVAARFSNAVGGSVDAPARDRRIEISVHF